jgi:hypothetical protein
MRVISFLNTIVLVNGVEVVEWGDGNETIGVERRVDSATDKIGNSGEMLVILSADKSGVFSFRIQQTSPSNLYFSTLINGQENGAFVPIFVQFKDTRGGDLASGTQGYMRKFPGVARGNDANDQTWQIVVERLDLVLGNVAA